MDSTSPTMVDVWEATGHQPSESNRGTTQPLRAPTPMEPTVALGTSRVAIAVYATPLSVSRVTIEGRIVPRTTGSPSPASNGHRHDSTVDTISS